MKNVCIGLLLSILLCNPVFAQKTIVSEFDGSDWQAWTEAKKYNFLTGFLLGTSYVIRNNEPFMSKNYSNPQFDGMRKKLSGNEGGKRKHAQASFNKAEVILWGHYRAAMVQNGLSDFTVVEITVNQLSKGMDELYKDPKNAKIRIADAIYTVKKQINGTSRGDIEKILAFLREEKRDPAALWVHDGKGKVVKSIAFP